MIAVRRIGEKGSGIVEKYQNVVINIRGEMKNSRVSNPIHMIMV